MDDETNTYRKVYELARTVYDDKFLNALIEQIYVESNGKVILVPKLGRQKILFGDIASVDHKFEKLKAFYKTGMPNSGWNRFKYLNLEWKDQVVGQY
jgi:cell division protein FtsQ